MVVHLLLVQKNTPNVKKKRENFITEKNSATNHFITFHLPKEVVDADKINAKYENGLLCLVIPKREEAKQEPSRLIDIS